MKKSYFGAWAVFTIILRFYMVTMNYLSISEFVGGNRISFSTFKNRGRLKTYLGSVQRTEIFVLDQESSCDVKGEFTVFLIIFIFTYSYHRTPEDTEPSLSLSLKEYKLDRAEEAWRSYAFKIFKETSSADVHYFAAVSHAEQIRWLNVLAKAIHKEKFSSSSKLVSLLCCLFCFFVCCCECIVPFVKEKFAKVFYAKFIPKATIHEDFLSEIFTYNFLLLK